MRFDPGFVAWCFQRNTDFANANQHCEKPAQAMYNYPAGIASLHSKQVPIPIRGVGWSCSGDVAAGPAGCWIPAKRAPRIDPLMLLREE